MSKKEKPLSQVLDEYFAERNSFFDRMDEKVADFREFLSEKDKEFKLMEAEEKANEALKRNPKLGETVH